METTEYSRKIDSCGRLVIPAKLREKLNIHEGENYDFSVAKIDGKTYLCIECYNVEDEIEKACQILRAAGIDKI